MLLVVTSASLLVTSALLVVTMFASKNKCMAYSVASRLEAIALRLIMAMASPTINGLQSWSQGPPQAESRTCGLDVLVGEDVQID